MTETLQEAQEAKAQTLTVKQVAKMLGVHELTVRRRCYTGEIPSFKVGARRLFKRSAIEALMNGEQPRPEAVSDGT